MKKRLFKPVLLATLACGIIVFASAFTANNAIMHPGGGSQAVAFDEDGEDPNDPAFQMEHYQTVDCSERSVTYRTYYDANGSVVGTGILEGGTVRITSGYSTSVYIESTGTVGAHTGTIVQCYDRSVWGCNRVTAEEACQ